MDEAIDEEEAILAQQEPVPRVLDLGAFREPVSRLQPRPPLVLPLDATVRRAVDQMRERHVGCVLVVDAERLVGILTERDLLLKAETADLERPVAEFMTPDPDVLPPDAPIVYALNLMSVGGYRHVPLVDAAHRPVGIVSVTHVVHYLVTFFPEEVLTLPPDPMKAGERRQREGA